MSTTRSRLRGKIEELAPARYIRGGAVYGPADAMILACREVGVSPGLWERSASQLAAATNVPVEDAIDATTQIMYRGIVRLRREIS